MTREIKFENNRVIVETENEVIYYEYASFGSRLGARIIDCLIIIIPVNIIPLIPAWLYWSLLQSGDNQATVGQKALNIKILSTDGVKISFGQATGRFFGDFLNILTFFVGYFLFFFSEKKQCLHDLVSNTIVVKAVEKDLKIIGVE